VAAEQLIQAIVIVLLIVVMGGFALGTQRNIRIGNDVLRWLQAGLPLIGPRSTLRWIGSSAVELRIAEAHEPFRDATVVVVLEPRDIGLIWLFSRARGRRDFMIVRANLRNPPRFALDAGDPRAWTGPLDEPEAGERAIDWPDPGRALASAGADEEMARTTWRRLADASDGVWRLTIQPVVPHLEIHVRPPTSREVPADRLIGPIRDLAAGLGSRR
jgi:hypothetical protein